MSMPIYIYMYICPYLCITHHSQAYLQMVDSMLVQLVKSFKCYTDLEVAFIHLWSTIFRCSDPGKDMLTTVDQLRERYQCSISDTIHTM